MKRVKYLGIGARGENNAQNLYENSFPRSQVFRGQTVKVPARNVFALAYNSIGKGETSGLARKAFEKGGDKFEFVFYNELGKLIVDRMKKIIDKKTVLKRNAPATIKIKGFNWPLVWNGAMRKALDYVVK